MIERTLLQCNYHQCPVFITEFLTWVSWQDPVENVEGGVSPGAVCTLNSSYLCNHTVKISSADTLWLSCVALERLERIQYACS